MKICNQFLQDMTDKLKKRLEKKFGRQIYPRDCKLIAEEIGETTGQHISDTTQKRLLGFAQKVKPQQYTLDAICRYMGYENWLDFVQVNSHKGFSDLGDVVDIDSKELAPGDHVEIEYYPDRYILFQYLGGKQYKVVRARNAKLVENDRVCIDYFIRGMSLVAQTVIRNGEEIGEYRAAIEGGLNHLQIIQADKTAKA